MPSPVVFADRNENILVEVERGCEPLGKDVHNVVVAVRTVVEFDAKGVLPFLRLQNVVSVGRMKNKPFEVQLAHAVELRAQPEVHIEVVTDAIRSLYEPNLRIEIRPDLAVSGDYFEPVGLKIEPCAKLRLP